MADDTAAVETEMFSKEYVEKLKADLASKSEEAAKLKAFKSTFDERQRDVISKLQPDIQSFVEGLAKNNVDYAEDMKPLVDWSRSCHESANLETAMPLARVISCASAQFKRTREEASVLSDKANTLSATMKELEDIKADASSKAQRIVELESLANERQLANEELQKQLSLAGVIAAKDKFDFSKLSSREAAASKELVPSDTVTDPDHGLKATTSNASRGKAPMVEDELFAFIRGTSRGSGSNRISQSQTNHAILGSSGNSFEEEVASAIRNF